MTFQLAEPGIEVVRRQIQSGCDRDDRVPLGPPTVGQKEMAELGKQYQALEVRRIDPFAESAEKPKPLPNSESSS